VREASPDRLENLPILREWPVNSYLVSINKQRASLPQNRLALCFTCWSSYGIQLESTFTTLSGWAGSLVMRCTPKLCGPSIPSCIMKTLDSTIVLSPGLRTIEPMVNSGGQHPSNTWIYGFSLKRNKPSPVLVTLIAKVLLTPNFTSP